MALSLFSNDPFFSHLERTIDNAFNRAFIGVPRSMLVDSTEGNARRSRGALMPWTSMGSGHPMDIVEKDGSYAIVTDAPGFTPSDIKVELSGNTLVISGEKAVEKKDKDKAGRMVREERTFRKFTRSFVLPENAQPEGISAKLEHGVLTVEVPKAEEVKKPEPKRIAVQAGGAGSSSSVPASHL